jgi:hypothetical protein
MQRVAATTSDEASFKVPPPEPFGAWPTALSYNRHIGFVTIATCPVANQRAPVSVAHSSAGERPDPGKLPLVRNLQAIRQVFVLSDKHERGRTATGRSDCRCAPI